MSKLINNILRKIGFDKKAADEPGKRKLTSKECKKCKHVKVGCYYSDECPRT